MTLYDTINDLIENGEYDNNDELAALIAGEVVGVSDVLSESWLDFYISMFESYQLKDYFSYLLGAGMIDVDCDCIGVENDCLVDHMYGSEWFDQGLFQKAQRSDLYLELCDIFGKYDRKEL